jgi:Spx/MgsR family transcriptional regulator
MSVTIHGMRNCDTMKRARAWLEARGITHRFRDDKSEPPRPGELAAWAEAVGWEKLLNRAGTTFRTLPESERSGLDEGRALALMLVHPSLIRRPVLEAGGRVLVGFDEAAWTSVL